MNGDPRPLADLQADAASTLVLLDLARAGESQALDRLFERYVSPLQRFARGRLPVYARDLLDTGDLVQETLVQTLKHIERFEPRREGALWAYLRQALVNRIRDEVRRVMRRPPPGALDSGHPDEGASPLEQAVGRQATERYEAALLRLKPEEREAVIARVELGHTFEEIAAALDKPSAEAARKTVSRALVRLAEEMRRG